MSRLRSIAGLCSRALAAGPMLAGQGSVMQAAAKGTRGYAMLSATAAAATMGSTMTLRVMGYNVPYPFILGSAIAVAGGVYWYELVATKHEKEAPLIAYVEAAPHIRSLHMTDHAGRPFTAKDLFGKFCVIDFGTVAGDTNTVAAMTKAAESVKQRSGTEIAPVFISLDPAHDKPEDLKRMAQEAGGTNLVALTGDADGLLACANRFKKQELSGRMLAAKDQESIKHGDTLDPTYISSYLYVVNPNGDFVSMMSKALPVDKMSNQICLSI